LKPIRKGNSRKEQRLRDVVIMSWIPGWDSVAAAGWWSGFYFWLSIVCLIGLGIAEVASHRYSERREELASAEQNEIQRRHDQEMTAVQHDTAQANERAAQLEREAADLRLALEGARAETLRLSQGVARHVSPTQAELFKSLFAGKHFRLRMNSESSPEPRQYRDELASALAAAGQEITGIIESTAQGATGVEVYGAVNDDAAGADLARILIEANVQRVSFRAKAGGNTLAIRVGANPTVP
jgi:hypothetical protein